MGRVIEELKRFRELDIKYSEGRIFGSMCSSIHPLAKEIVSLFLETNLGDPGLFKGTKLLEEKAVKLLGEILKNKEPYGFIVSGGTEGNLLAMRVVKKMKGRTIILPKTAHFSFEKAKEMMDLNLVYAPLTKGYEIDVRFVKDYVEDYKVDGIVGIAGTTEFGTIDNIEKLSEIAKENDIYLHVDAAFGGFVIPFLPKEYRRKEINYTFDFSLNVDSITIDPHKMLLCPIPAGGIIFKNSSYKRYLEVDAPYLTETKQATILGTRPGFGAACTYGLLRYFGEEGLKKLVKEVMDRTFYFKERLEREGFKLLLEPILNIIAIEDENHIETCKKLKEMGYYPSVCFNAKALRIVVMPHIREEHIDNFIEVLKEVKRD
ncbi:Pyridoxal-dependent decarboxylase [Methanocaldococcus infernus ME]|uniref:Probable L-tyrosine/L-aspartate decarboxylase n=1 Tax=Methanocaldococcus infernus (strain DSM 11812 / JCM 15783 / ME) TaxID=573063 RepID=D5VUB3_METIM|nr:tyrosine decarboxylase MfnA [Methanocaldococcus infernus]ADG12725.1 Pyridoxal-dependent decarboxylase [Methanocaldococcus infernus ME]